MTWQAPNYAPGNGDTAANNPAWKYRQHQVEEATPLQRIGLVYDVALRACAQRDLMKLTRALRVLDDALDFSQGEVANRLSRLYQYCADTARRGTYDEGAYDEAAAVLRELRDAWAQAAETEHNQPASRPAQPAEPTAVQVSESGNLVTRFA